LNVNAEPTDLSPKPAIESAPCPQLKAVGCINSCAHIDSTSTAVFQERYWNIACGNFPDKYAFKLGVYLINTENANVYVYASMGLNNRPLAIDAEIDVTSKRREEEYRARSLGIFWGEEKLV
jgi:hypothetical protein